MAFGADSPGVVGEYVVTGRLGSGGMGVVYAARSASGRAVALKVVHEQFAEDEEFRTRFRQEVAAARRVSGAFTAAVVDADPAAERPWMATSYIPGPTLAERVDERGPLNGAELRRLAIGLVEALRDIHRAGVVHRDLKPANIVLGADGPRVIDFGISRAADAQTLTRTGRVLGTPPFMSPEQLISPQEVGPASDVFSLATVLAYAATGRGPFAADSPFVTAYRVVHEDPGGLDGLDPELRDALAPAWSKDPERRPPLVELLKSFRELPEVGGEDGGDGEDGVTGSAPGAALRTSPVAGWRGRVRRPGRRFVSGFVALVVVVSTLVIAVEAGALLRQDQAGRGGGTGVKDVGRRPGTYANVTGTLPRGFKGWSAALPDSSLMLYDHSNCLPRGDSLYCGTSKVLAARIGLSDGRIRWQIPRNADSPYGSQLTTPVVGVSDRTLVVMRVPPAQDSYTLVGLDVGNRKQRWSADVGTVGFTAATGSTVVASHPTSPAALQARHADSGKVLWTFRPPEERDTACQPFAAGARLYALCDRHGVSSVYALGVKGSTGARRIYGGGPEMRFVGADGALLVFLASVDDVGTKAPYRKAITVDTGAGETTGTGRGRTLALDQFSGSAVSVGAGRIYFARPDGKVAALSTRDGRQLWTTTVSKDGLSEPIVAGGLLLASTASGQVIALDLRNGKELWVTRRHAILPTMSDRPGRLTVVGRAVYGTASQTVFAFDAARPPKD
ncbi:PQQ-binding-like beta-propeller repeat protein [Streptomyces sp. NPDC051561]|uniref:protein kinase domain-containing protein n=1 Tax=Streptomyces sp. NPDC051561 TaxID=3365658 RepID=UPI00379472A0